MHRAKGTKAFFHKSTIELKSGRRRRSGRSMINDGTRSRSAKRGDNHFDIKGGVDGSFLVEEARKTVRNPYRTKISWDPMIAKRIGEAAVPGPTDALDVGTPAVTPLAQTDDTRITSACKNTSHAASNIAAIMAIQKLEDQLDAMHLAPSGLRRCN